MKGTIQLGRLLVMLLICGCVICLAGCAAPVKFSAMPARYSQVAIEVTGKTPSLDHAVVALRQQLLRMFKDSGAFATMALSEQMSNPDVLVMASITQEQHLDLTGLYYYGVYADVEVRDGNTGEVIQSSEIVETDLWIAGQNTVERMATAIHSFTVDALRGTQGVARQEPGKSASPAMEQKATQAPKMPWPTVDEKHALPAEKPAPPVKLAGVLEPKSIVSRHWAVVIGLSNYADSRIPGLRYAARDAKSFHDWLVSPAEGGYAPSRVQVLRNENATFAAIRESLFTLLGGAIEEDVVLIYFAGHGSPESPHAPQNLFLLPYDVDYDRIPTTAFPMWDVETALQRFIRAKRVVVIADACQPGGVGQQFEIARRAGSSEMLNPISAGLQDLSDVGEGVCLERLG